MGSFIFKIFLSLLLIFSFIADVFAVKNLVSSGGFNSKPGKELEIIPGTSWHWQLSGRLKKNIDVKLFDIDLIENDIETIQGLRDRGKIVICYFSAGTAENFRDGFDDIPEEIKGNPLEGFPDEFWLDIRDQRTRDYVNSRLDLAFSKSCDGVEPDNVDAYVNHSGFDLTASDQVKFNLFIAEEAHNRGLSVGLKNSLEIIPDLVDSFDWALNEQCEEFNECDTLLPFIQQNKAVFQAEYKKSFRKKKRRKKLCKRALKRKFNLNMYKISLNGKRFDCPKRLRNDSL